MGETLLGGEEHIGESIELLEEVTAQVPRRP